jgi:(p)ppGpp synthase/HD superfamily hydrolase
VAPLVARGGRSRDLVARLPKTRAALAYAEQQHAGQRRKADGAPFIEHPVEVAWLLYRAGAPDDVIAAGVLHDTIEKAGASVGELQDRFGPHTAELVAAVSDALMVFAADKISKVRELRSTRSVPRRRLTHYRRCLELLERLLSESPLVAQLRSEFDRVRAPIAA